MPQVAEKACLDFHGLVVVIKAPPLAARLAHLRVGGIEPAVPCTLGSKGYRTYRLHSTISEFLFNGIERSGDPL